MNAQQQQASSSPLVKAEGVTRIFGRGSAAVHALRGASLSIPSKQLIALRGRSGSGKTTLINILGALDRPTEGRVFFGGNEISGYSESKRNALRRKDMGLIFQSFGLVPLMTAYENVEFGLRIAGVKSVNFKSYTESALEYVGLKARMKHRPFEMSGGEQQRVAIARAIAHKPTLILADEPTAELDSKMGAQVMRVFKDLVQHEGMTIILTTHDPAIMSYADHVYALEDGQIVDAT
ncbi:ATP-binding cassette domain-containing protein [Paenibacillus sp. 5J-6]|jgi:putative ABC transport system ATP-binding protein|uniref:ATP-binding cassette domain-containing protein n=1 Tax=Paenibacillus silvestris TaxID=2606219 RepID=A0A6L8UYX8_9BACL|nr:ABC transporter ATP-binding protein [Paenibacillus silvestris]MZQ83134.1 ATP-binding cassette domain-containing protein [Paenibacillus silvestris]